MKTITFWSILMLCSLLCGCVNHINEEEEETGEEKTIQFNTHFLVTDAPIRSIEETVSKIVVSDCMNGEEVQKIEQSSSAEDFGKLSIPLKYGSHELLFIGHNSESCKLLYPSASFDKVTDTFSYYLSISVDESTPASQTISLSRSVGLLKVVATDAIPLGVSSLKISLSKYYPVVDVKTSLASGEPESMERTFEYKASHIGAKGSTYSIYTFIPETEFSTRVTIASMDAKGRTLHTSTIENVSIEKNRQTILSGNVFNQSSELWISINQKWGQNIEHPI